MRDGAARGAPALNGGPAAVPLGHELPLLGCEEAVVIALDKVAAQDEGGGAGRGERADELLGLGDVLPDLLREEELAVVDFARADLVVVGHGVVWAGVHGVPRL